MVGVTVASSHGRGLISQIIFLRTVVPQVVACVLRFTFYWGFHFYGFTGGTGAGGEGDERSGAGMGDMRWNRNRLRGDRSAVAGRDVESVRASELKVGLSAVVKVFFAGR